MRDINGVVVHCSATPPAVDIGVDEIRHLHTAPETEMVEWGTQMIPGRGWSDIGYHLVIRRNGALEGGRAFDRAGAHAAGYNKDTLGVCLIGGVGSNGHTALDNFTGPQKHTLEQLLRVVRAMWPDVWIKGHCELPGIYKACPSFSVRAFLQERNLV